ncbi:hypothetical protein DMENIID0001_159120 [Sergentomyia squamirostris]
MWKENGRKFCTPLGRNGIFPHKKEHREYAHIEILGSLCGEYGNLCHPCDIPNTHTAFRGAHVLTVGGGDIENEAAGWLKQTHHHTMN